MTILFPYRLYSLTNGGIEWIGSDPEEREYFPFEDIFGFNDSNGDLPTATCSDGVLRRMNSTFEQLVTGLRLQGYKPKINGIGGPQAAFTQKQPVLSSHPVFECDKPTFTGA